MNENRATIRDQASLYGWVVCCLAAVFYCFEYLLRIEPSVMAPQLMQSFGLTAGGLGTLAAMYYYAYTPMQIVVGVLTDHYGPKRVLSVALVCCVVGVFIFDATQDVWLAAFGRFLIGFGSAFAFVGVLKLAAMWLPEKRFALFAGVTTSLGMLGAMFGDIELSWAVKHYGWHSVMSGSMLFGILLVPIFVWFVADRMQPAEAPEAKLRLPQLLRNFWRLMRQPQLIYAGLIGCMLYLSLSVFAELWGISYLQASYPQMGRITIASINSLVFAGWFVGGPLNGWISDLIRSRRIPIFVGSVLAAASIAVVIFNHHLTVFDLSLLLFCFGLFSSAEVLCFAIARDFAAPRAMASAIGVINLLVMLSGMLLQPLVGYFLDFGWQGALRGSMRVYSVVDYQHALLVIPVAMLISAGLALLLKRKGRVHNG